MLKILAPVSALLLSVAIFQAGSGLQGTLLPLRANFEAFGTLWIGVIGSGYFMGFGLGCWAGPWIVRRVGHIRSFAAMTSLASAAVLFHVLVLEPWAWTAMRFISGFCFAIIYMVIESWINDRAAPENRGQLMSIYTVINFSFITVGQMMTSIDDPRSFPLFLLASVLVSIAAVPVALTRQAAPQPPTSVTLKLVKLWRLSPVGVAGCLVVGLTNGAFWTFAAVYAQRIGFDVAGTATFMSVAVIGGALAQWPLGWASDRVDRRKVIAVAALGALLFCAGLTFLKALPQDQLLGLVFAFGVFAFPLYALVVAHANDYASPEDFVETSGGLLLTYAVGAVIGPILASSVMDLMGNGGLFAFMGGVYVLFIGFTLARMARRQAIPAAERDNFVPVATATSPEAYQIDPRSEETSGPPASKESPKST